MEIIDRYRRSLKRKNYAAHTVKAYMNVLAQFTRWLDVPLERVTRSEMGAYVDHLFQKRLSPKTVTCHLQIIRAFYEYLINEEGMVLDEPCHQNLHPPAETVAPPPKGRSGCKSLLCHHESA